MSFVNLNVLSYYSFMKSKIKNENYIEFAKKHNIKT